MKKVLSFFLAIILIIGVVPLANLDLKASAASFTPRLTAPERSGYYGTQNEYNPFRTNSDAGNGNCTWYAWGRAYEILGSRPQIGTGNASTWYGTSSSYSHGSTPKLGAIACWSGGSTGAGHVAVVEQINDNGTIVISESSWSATNWWFRTQTISSNGYYGGSLSFQGYIYLGNFTSGPPTAVLSVDETCCDNQTNVYFSFSGENTIGVFTLGIYKNNSRVDTVQVEGYSYHQVFSEPGNYSAYMTSYSSNGDYADSNWVSWKVYDKTTATLSADQKKMLKGETINFSLGGDNSGVYTLAIFKDGTLVEWEPSIGHTYQYTVTSTGSYSAFITAYSNHIPSADSEYVYWDVYDIPTKPIIKSIEFNSNGSVTLSWTPCTINTSSYSIRFYKEGETSEFVFLKRVTTETAYTYSLLPSGRYYAMVTAEGNGGWTHSDKSAVFEVLPPSKPMIKSITQNTDGSVSLEWTPCPINTLYFSIRFYKEGETSEFVFLKGVTTDTKYTYSLLPAGRYYAMVTAQGRNEWTHSDKSAVFEIKPYYLITFNSNGGNCPISSKNITFNLTYDTLPIPTRTGYNFDGWYTEETGGDLITSSTIVTATADHTLYAHWSHDTFIIKTANLSISNKLISGQDLPKMSPDDLAEQFENTNISVIMKNENRMATGTTVNLVDDTDTVYDTLTVVISGDIDGDGLTDGRDSLIVNCLVNSILTREQVGEAEFKAADCNHDGVIDENDVILLESAGLIFSNISQ